MEAEDGGGEWRRFWSGLRWSWGVEMGARTRRDVGTSAGDGGEGGNTVLVAHGGGYSRRGGKTTDELRAGCVTLDGEREARARSRRWSATAEVGGREGARMGATAAGKFKPREQSW